MLSDDSFSSLLASVERPARYTGGEVNSITKPFDSASFRLALAFPDIYDIAMSHYGFQILYGLVNARSDSLAERVFMPWGDMAAAMRQVQLPLFTLESRRPLTDFHVIGFSLQYEACYPTVLAMLDLAGIPRRREDRRAGDFPLVIAGGPCTFNPEALADFVDLFFIGDGEDSLPAFIDLFVSRPGLSHAELVEAASLLTGIYAPELYSSSGVPLAGLPAPSRVQPAVVKDLDAAYFPTSPVIPTVQAVHERISLEIMRGCGRGCRFCQAGMTRRPVRFRSVARLLELAEESYANTGYDEISLLSLSTGDYPFLKDLARRLNHAFAPRAVGLSFPSLRADKALLEIPEIMKEVRKGAITVAAEAGNDSLRTVINKGITEKGILDGLAAAFEAGWNRVKLYFMVGLPTETLDDVASIADLVEKVLASGRSMRSRPQVNCSISPFIPKPGTPFQWEPMASREYLEAARSLLFDRLRRTGIKASFHNLNRSILEAALARAGREIAPVLDKAADLGCSLDAWDEFFDYSKWVEAFNASGLDIEKYACRSLSPDAPLPWSHISPGVEIAFLLAERARALGSRVG